MISEASADSTPPTDVYLLNETAAARFLGFTPRALQAWRMNGRGPQFVRISSRAVRYRHQDLVEWAENHLRSSTAGI